VGGAAGEWGSRLVATGSVLCSKSCVHILSIKSDMFPVGVGLHQGCPSSPVLFVNFRLGGNRIASLLFADDVVLLASSDHDLRHSLERFSAECEMAGLESAPPNLRPWWFEPVD